MKARIQDFMTPRALSGAAHACDGDEHVQGNPDIDRFQVVLGGPADDDRLAASFGPLPRNLDGLPAAEIFSGDRILRLYEAGIIAPVDDLPSRFSRPRPQIDDQVGRL